MRITTRKERCQAALERWAKQYKRCPARAFQTATLLALPPEQRTPAVINAIIGNDSWTRHECDECGKDKEVLVLIGSEPDWDAQWQELCHECLLKAADLASKRQHP